MKKVLFSLSLLLQMMALYAQKSEQGFDFFFKPTDKVPRYQVITEKNDTVWHRIAYYIPEKTVAMEGWYKDRDCKIPHGRVLWYFANGALRSKETYVNGEKEGVWLQYSNEGKLLDSVSYNADKQKGIRLRWFANGKLADSLKSDGAGNASEVSYYEDGTIASEGRWISDTAKTGKWTYYYANGKIKAVENYGTAGKRLKCDCFNEAGRQLDPSECGEKEAGFPGGVQAWSHYISLKLNPNVPVKKKAPEGNYTVVVQFIVDKDGKVSNITSLTNFGYGMEDEVIRVLRQSPRWEPAQQYGHKVNAYRRQPITFVVSKG